MDGASGFFRYLYSRFGKLVILAIIVLIAVWLVQYFDFETHQPQQLPAPVKNSPNQQQPATPPKTPANEPAPINSEINRRLSAKKLIYTKHARCRMECRNISEKEVVYVLKNGEINMQKSDASNAPCPKYAIESETSNKESVRIIFADCPDATKVITAIDLNNNHDTNCHCN